MSAWVLAASERIVSFQDLGEPEAVRNQELRVDEPRGDGEFARPEALQVEVDLGAVHADVGDDAAWGH